MTPEQLVMLPLWYAVFLLSITCHEAAHAWAAYRGGDETAYLGGQVTLNPLPHIQREPFGTVAVPMITFMLMGFTMGWASAPYDPLWEDRHPRRAAAMAAAGPLANLALALIGFMALRIGLGAGVWEPPAEAYFQRMVAPTGGEETVWEPIGRFLSVLFGLNLLLFVFNLIPFPPLDGSAVVAGLFEPARRLRDQLRESGMGSILGLVVAYLVIQNWFSPLLVWCMTRLY